MESPFQNMLNTNYAPTPEEVVQIREFCIKPERDIKELDAEITQLQDMISSLEAKREQIQDTLDAHRALISPIKRLSPELLQQIFVWCLPGQRNPVMHSSEAPLLLGRICNGWRQIVYKTAELWSAIHVVIPSVRNAEQASLRCEAIKDWLMRTGECPLSISICHDLRDVHLDHSVVDGAVMVSTLEVLTSFCQRWCSLEVQMSAENAIHLCDVISGNVPLLRKFHFTGGGGRMRLPHDPDYLEKMLQFILLHDLQHVGVAIHMNRPNPGRWSFMPNPSLQSISLTFSAETSTVATQILDLLSALPSLRQCTVQCSGLHMLPGQTPTALPPVSPIQRPPVILDKLQRLTMLASTPLMPIFDNLVTPALTDVNFLPDSSNSQTFKSVFNSFARMLDRSSATLTKLTLGRNTECVLGSLGDCLLHCPGLKELVVDRRYDTRNPLNPVHTTVPAGDSILNVLMPRSSGTESNALCPGLQTLTLIGFSTSILTHTTLGKFLRLRSEMVVPLERLYVRPPTWNHLQVLSPDVGKPMPPPRRELDKYPEEFEAELEELRSKGMMISIQAEAKMVFSTSSSPWLGLSPTMAPSLSVQSGISLR